MFFSILLVMLPAICSQVWWPMRAESSNVILCCFTIFVKWLYSFHTIPILVLFRKLTKKNEKPHFLKFHQMVLKCPVAPTPSSSPTLSTEILATSPSLRNSGPNASCRKICRGGHPTHTSPFLPDSATASVRMEVVNRCAHENAKANADTCTYLHTNAHVNVNTDANVHAPLANWMVFVTLKLIQLTL